MEAKPFAEAGSEVYPINLSCSFSFPANELCVLGQVAHCFLVGEDIFLTSSLHICDALSICINVTLNVQHSSAG